MLSSVDSKSTNRQRAVALAAATALVLAAWLAAAFPVSAQPNASQQTIDLAPRWTYAGWLGPDGFSIATALTTNAGPAGDLSDEVTSIWTWDAAAQAWRAYFPGSEDIPGVNDFDTFEYSVAYAIAYTGAGPTQWIIPTP